MENQLKETELRLNNLIYDVNNNLCYVSNLRKDLIIAKYLGIGSALGGIEDFKGVPLSEDTLLKLGFEKGFHRYGLENCGLKCHKSLKENYWIVSQGFGMQFTELTEIQYIHQLQNLFFSLCGEELTFKKW